MNEAAAANMRKALRESERLAEDLRQVWEHALMRGSLSERETRLRLAADLYAMGWRRP